MFHDLSLAQTQSQKALFDKTLQQKSEQALHT